MSFTNYLESVILDEVFGGVNYTPPATVYVGLSTTAINDDGTGVTEPTGGGYARVAVANNATNWPATGTDGTKSNGTTITFPQATADWGTVTHFFIADSNTGGILAYAAIGVSKTIGVGDTASFGVDSLTITLD
ncbi:hypothetical protein [Priestia megaterium]|uniref:phage tail fiber protein n=1 Tax=Priestia megaterium TaxID=1404 RepID=UPI002E1DD3BE|nr:hypothetical protein [Priestia megaterium]